MKREIVTFIDDIDGTDAEHTVEFTVNGQQFSIDLSEKNAVAFQKVLAPWMAKARKVGKVTSLGNRRGAVAAAKRDTGAIRAWAAVQGIILSDRGRIPGNVEELYSRRAVLTPEDERLMIRLRGADESPVVAVPTPTFSEAAPAVKAAAKPRSRTAKKATSKPVAS